MAAILSTLPQRVGIRSGPLSESWTLYRHGYLVAAVATARITIETELHRLSGGRCGCRGLSCAVQQLRDRGRLPPTVCNEAQRAYSRLSLIIHGRPIEGDEARELLENAERVCLAMADAFG